MLSVDGRAVRVRTLDRGDLRSRIRQSQPVRLTPREIGSVHAYVASHDLSQLAIRDARGELRLRGRPETNEWHLVTPELVHSMSMDREGNRLAAILQETKGLCVWSTANRKTLLQVEDGRWTRIEVSPDGHWLAAASVEQVKVWDLENGQSVLRRPRQAEIPPQLAWSPDGAWLLMNEVDSEVRLLASDTWAEVATFPAPPLMTSPAFSLDGSKLALPGQISGVQLWNLTAVRKRLRDLGLDWPEQTNPVSRAKK